MIGPQFTQTNQTTVGKHRCFNLVSGIQPPEEKEALLLKEEYQEEVSKSNFLYLTLDLPTAPLYKDEKEQLIIPQVPLFNILGKFNGNTEKVRTRRKSVLVFLKIRLFISHNVTHTHTRTYRAVEEQASSVLYMFIVSTFLPQ